MILFLKIFKTLSLSLPLIMELKDDRKGDTKKNKKTDLYWRVSYALLAATVCCMVDKLLGQSTGVLNFILYFLLSLATHFQFFDYLIFEPLKVNGVITPSKFNWFNYLGKTSDWDKWEPWVKIGPWGRLTVKILVFVPLLTLYLIHL